MEETYIQLSVLVQASLQLLGRKALREHSLPDSAHVQLSLSLAGSSGATVAHSADQVKDLGARRLVAAAVTVVLVQAGLADLDQAERLVDIIANDLVGEAQTRESLAGYAAMCV
jgi:hypothetical protein